MNNNKLSKGILLCLISCISFGGQWPVAGKALKTIDPFYFTGIRYLIVAVILLILVVAIEGKDKLKFEGKKVKLWFYGSMAFAIYNFLVFTGQKMIGVRGAILGSLLMALIPFVSILASWIYKGIKPSPITLICIFVSFVGVCLVITKGNFQFFVINKAEIFPIFLMLLSVLAWVIYTIGVSEFPDWSPLRYTALSCVMGNISSIIIISFLTCVKYIHIPSFTLIRSIGFEMFYMSIVSGVIGVYCWNSGNKLIGAINGALFMNLVPIVTFIISVIMGYKISLLELVGALLTLTALFSNNLYQRSVKNNAPPVIEDSLVKQQ